MKWFLSKSFTLNDKIYACDAETLAVLREQVQAQQIECIAAIMTLGLKSGRIKEICS